MMVALDKVRNIVDGVAQERFPANDFARTIAEPVGDSEGKEALRVTLVLTSDAIDALTGDEALDLLVAIQNALFNAGEERFAVVEYATEAELREDIEDAEPIEDDA